MRLIARVHQLPIVLIAGLSLTACVVGPVYGSSTRQVRECPDSVATVCGAVADSSRCLTLSDRDYEEVAAGLGISVACIRAVVDIETGSKCKGFGADSLPVINFDINMFRKYARARRIDLAPYRSKYPEVFAKPDVRRHGSLQRAQYARLNSAMAIDTVAALEGTFWGMFQIGGFNWKLCGCGSVEDFVARMALSEREQLELFAAFVRARKLDVYLRKRDWAGFALRYNGPGYKKHRYDTRMAQAYRRYKNKGV